MLNLREAPSDLSRSPNGQTPEYRRIEQVMITLNNLSFEESNAEFMANKSPTLIEFLIMCTYCSESQIELRKHALDILTNLSRKLKLSKMSESHKSLLLISLSHLIIGQDNQTPERLDIIRGLEILTKLCSQPVDPIEKEDYTNEKLLAEYIEDEEKSLNQSFVLDKIIKRLEELLSYQDVFILMHSLECLYHMSQFSEPISDLIVKSSSSKIIQMLMNFLTVDMSHFGVPQNQSEKKVSNGPMKIFKVMSNSAPLTSNTNIVAQPQTPQTNSVVNSCASSTQNSPVVVKVNNNSASLLQQTLNNQHNLNTAQNFKNEINSNLNIQQQQINQLLNNGNFK